MRVHLSHLDNGVGAYDHQRGEIHVSFGLSPIEQRCVLAHELGHAFYGHEQMSPRHERQADAYAADLLIDVEQLADLDRLGLHDYDIADELDVTAEILAAYRSHNMQRLGSIIYPRKHRSAFTNTIARVLSPRTAPSGAHS